MKKKNHSFVLFLCFIILVLLFCIYYFLFSKFNISVPCVFHKITGFYCPGCGVTRMIFSLFRLDFYQAFRYNSLLFISLPFILFYFFDFIIKFLLYKDNYLYRKISDRTWYLLLMITLIFGVLRNIPMFAFLQPMIV